jgi:hypothetical protein
MKHCRKVSVRWDIREINDQEEFMGKVTLGLLLAIFLLCGGAQAGTGWFGDGEEGSGDLETVELDLEPFTVIKSSTGLDINITFGDKQKVLLTIDDNLVDRIKARVRGDVLKIESRGDCRMSRRCQLDITLPKLESVQISGSSDVIIEDFEGDFLDLAISGSGDMTVNGHTNRLEITISGSGDINTRALTAREASVSISGSGDVRVYADERLDAGITGSGDISYYGDPDHVDRTVRGSGDIRKGR